MVDEHDVFYVFKSLISLNTSQLQFLSILHNFSVLAFHIRRRQWHPTPVLLPGESHGRGSLVGRCPWGLEESDMIERLPFHFSLSCIGEGNGNLLQCSCLEKPRDRWAWWAAVYGVAQSQTGLKWLSSSSSSLSHLLFNLIPKYLYFHTLLWMTWFLKYQFLIACC